jgi:hypothetical protein
MYVLTSRILNAALDIIFPKKALVRELERMDALEFTSRVRPSGAAQPLRRPANTIPN